MKINDSERFAHPILSPTTEDFGDSALILSVEILERPATSELTLRCTLATDHSDFAEALENDAIACSANIVCLDTFYNAFHPIDLGLTEITVKPGMLRGRTSIKAICTTTQGLDVAAWAGLHNEFDKVACKIPEKTVLGLSEEFVIDVGLDKLRPFESIFRLVKQDTLEPDRISIDVDSQYILIAAPKELYFTINALRNSPTTRDVLLNSVYFAATLEVLTMIKEDPGSFEGQWWFRVFQARCVRLGLDIANTDLLEGAQILLNQPLGRLVKLQGLME